MQDMILPILVCVAIAFLLLGVVQVVMGINGEKKKLAERLSSDGKRGEGFDPATFTVVRREQKIGGMSGTLSHLPFMHKLAHNLSQTWPKISLAKFAFISLGLGILGFFITTGITGTMVIGSTGGLLGIMPYFVLNSRRTRHQRMLIEQVPEALDFLSRILRAGHSLSTGMQMMAEELPKPLSEEFRRTYDQHSLGQSMDDALKDTAVRVDNTDFGFFVTAVLIQRQTGGDLSEVLTNISGMIRNRIRLAAHVKAKTAEGRFTGYILTVFPVVMFFISYYLNPKYADVLLHTSTGIMLLCIAGGMLGMGMFVIRKITTVKV